jgi:Protein of unknown function (DUF3106)
VTADRRSQPGSAKARRLCAAVVSACWLLSGAALAQSLPGTGPIPWNELSPAQRGVLAPLEPDWKAVSPAQQQKWAEVARRYPALPAEERSRVQTRLSDWSRLSPQERAAARLNFQESRQLSPQERQQQWDTYRALPADQRRALAESAERARPAAVPKPRTQPGNGDNSIKSSVVRAPAPQAAQPVGPTVVQRGSGASTTLVSKPVTPPLHQQAGLPKVAATPGFVDGATLLPQRGAQGAAARAAERDDDKKARKAQ